jgi:hypothetical protein
MLTETPVLENVLAALDCEIARMLPRYDHAIGAQTGLSNANLFRQKQDKGSKKRP